MSTIIYDIEEIVLEYLASIREELLLFQNERVKEKNTKGIGRFAFVVRKAKKDNMSSACSKNYSKRIYSEKNLAFIRSLLSL